MSKQTKRLTKLQRILEFEKDIPAKQRNGINLQADRQYIKDQLKKAIKSNYNSIQERTQAILEWNKKLFDNKRRINTAYKSINPDERLYIEDFYNSLPELHDAMDFDEFFAHLEVASWKDSSIWKRFRHVRDKFFNGNDVAIADFFVERNKSRKPTSSIGIHYE